MEWEYVLLDKSEGIATITLNRPEKLNAFVGNMREQILEALEDACTDDEVRVVVRGRICRRQNAGARQKGYQ